jgi:hypothetical protein
MRLETMPIAQQAIQSAMWLDGAFGLRHKRLVASELQRIVESCNLL